MSPDVTPLTAVSDSDIMIEEDAPVDPSPAGRNASLLVDVANALGAAWATFQLYPDPRGRLGFENALADLSGAPVIEYLAVGAHDLLHDGAEVPSTHDGVGRLCERLFGAGIAALEFLAEPTGDDLVALFETICRTRRELDEEGGPTMAFKASGAHTMRVIEQHALIDGDPDSDDVRRPGGLSNPLDYSGDPEALASALIDASNDDPATLASLVIRAYERAHFLIDPGDVREREEIVHTFVDTFFYLPERYQAPTIAEMLSRHEDEPFRTFLDQFATHEVQALAPLLDANTHPLLAEYAAIASERTDRPDELTELIDEVAGGHPIDDMVTRRIEAILTPGTSLGESLEGGAFTRLAEQKPDPIRHRETGIRVLRGLMDGDITDHDRRRLMRIWSGKVVDAIRHTDPVAAHAWLDAAPLGHDSDAGSPTASLSRAINIDVTAHVVEIVDADPEAATSSLLVERLASQLLGHLVELLGKEQDQARRRQLIEIATHAARVDPQPILSRLGDPRWYLLRNLAMILGRSQHPEVAPHLRRLCVHPDERVRREAIRAVYSLTRDDDLTPFIDALTDPSPTVRKAAATILRSAARSDFVTQLERILLGPAADESKLDVISLLGVLDSDAARSILERASKGGATRGLRGAARDALEAR